MYVSLDVSLGGKYIQCDPESPQAGRSVRMSVCQSVGRIPLFSRPDWQSTGLVLYSRFVDIYKVMSDAVTHNRKFEKKYFGSNAVALEVQWRNVGCRTCLINIWEVSKPSDCLSARKFCSFAASSTGNGEIRRGISSGSSGQERRNQEKTKFRVKRAEKKKSGSSGQI